MFPRIIGIVLLVALSSFGQIYRNYIVSDESIKSTAITRNRKMIQEHYPDGVLRTETEFFNERRDGLMRAYYPTGVLEAEIPFKNGREHGTARFFYKSGILHKTIEFERGKVREATTYGLSGEVISVVDGKDLTAVASWDSSTNSDAEADSQSNSASKEQE